MIELLAKLESYRIFNYLYPGSLFLFACDWIGVFEIKNQSLLINAFVAYFCGMTLSRIGSVVIEPILKFTRLISYSSFETYVKAEKIDPKIQTLLGEANTFRTLIATAITYILVVLAKRLVDLYYFKVESIQIAALFAVTVLYICAYWKQVKFIEKRVIIATIE